VQSAGYRFTFDSEIWSMDLPALLASAEEARAERKRRRQTKTEDA
jgi:hypothetical protein